MATNLSEYYTEKGQALPSIADRQGVATQAGIKGYSGSAEQNTQLLNFLQGQGATAGISASPIPSDVLKNQTPITFSNPPAPLDSASALVSGVSQTGNDLQSYINELTPPKTEAQNKYDALTSRINALLPELAGKAQTVATQEQNAGIPALKNQLADINSQIGTKTAEYNVLQAQNQNKPITMNSIIGSERAILNAKGADLGLLQAQALGLQGKISAAQDAVSRAVDLKYASIQDEIDIKKAQLELIKPQLDTEQKRVADAQLLIQKKKEAELQQSKEDTATIMSWAIAASKNGATSYQAQQIANLARADKPDLQKAFAVYAPFAKNPSQEKAAILELENKRLQNLKLQSEVGKINAEIQGSGIPKITNQDAGKYAGALSVILGSQKFTKDQKASITNAINSGEDPLAVIKNQARSIMSGTNQTDAEKYEVIKTQLEDLQTLLSDYYANGGKTNIFTGNIEKTINKLGEVRDPKLVGIATNIASSLQAYRNAISGTAYSEQEGKDIAAIFPGINKSSGLNTAILNGRLQFVNTTLDAKYRSVLGNTYDSIKNADKPDTMIGADGTVYKKNADGTYSVASSAGTPSANTPRVGGGGGGSF